jgi:2-haloacid dehalogenase
LIDLQRFKIFSFDCYGTLIDWETGIVNAMQPILDEHGVDRTDDEILQLFAELESVVQRPPYKPYREVLGIVAGEYAQRWDFNITDEEISSFANSVPNWPAFPDSVDGLERLGKHVDLVILSNIDDELFAESAKRLGAEFAHIITAEQVGSYKPDLRNFEALLDRIDTPKDSLLHVAQSRFHDIAPANHLGLSTVWVNRRAGQQGDGATPAQEAVPDLEVANLATLADMVDRAFIA